MAAQVTDESQLQVTPRDGSLLSVSKARSNLIARGRRDAAVLRDQSVADIMKALRKSLDEAGQKSVEQKQAELREWEGLAAQGHLEAQSSLGHYYWGKDDAESAKWFYKAAEQGDALAQFEIGEMYRKGKGLPQDCTKAVHWLHKSAEQGYDEAEWSLADIYYYGEGVPQDYTEAARWVRRAAEYGEFCFSQYFLGMMYAEGKGVSQDYITAHMWINLAVSRAEGDDQAKFSEARDELAAKMTPEQLAEAQRLAREWRPK